jgi:hypothetical protein
VTYDLQQASVPAGVCQTAEDRCDLDPQLTALHWLTEVTGTKIGRWPVAEVAVKMSASPVYIGGRLDRGTPAMARTTTTCTASCWGCRPKRLRN